MGAPIYKKVNAKHYCLFGENWTQSELDTFVDATPEAMAEFFKDEPLNSGEESCVPIPEWRTREWNDRSYYGSLLGSTRIWLEDFSLPTVTAKLNDVMIIVNIYGNSTYIGGGYTLDWDVGFSYASAYEYRKDFLTQYDSKEELFEDVADFYFEELECFRKYKATESDKASFKKYLSDAFDKYSVMADRFCQENCDEVLEHKGFFLKPVEQPAEA